MIQPLKVVKSLVLALFLVLAALTLPASTYAQTTNLEPGVCVSVYGGGVVCGAKHEVVPTALGDNPALLGAGFLAASGILIYLSKKMKKQTSHISG